MVNRRGMIRAFVAALCIAAGSVTQTVNAQSYPAKPIKMLVGFGPGGPADTVARILAQRLGSEIGQPVIVENKPGADTRIAMEMVATSPPDGYTIALADSGLAVNSVLYVNPPYDAVKDFTPIFYIGEIPNFIAVTPSLNVKTLGDFLAYAKARPGDLNYAGTASSTIIAAEMLNSVAGLRTVLVRYKGAAFGIPALASGEVQFMVSAVGGLVPLIKAGKVKALAVTAPQRTPLMPDIPTTAEAGLPEMVYVNWYSIIGPAGMPTTIVERLNAELRKVVADPEIASKIRAIGLEPTPRTPADFSAKLKDELTKLEKVVRSANLKVQ